MGTSRRAYEPPTPLPQRVLRNEISRVLRDAEAGQRFAVTVNGRVVAELGPPSEQPRGVDWQTAHAVIARARAHPDPTFWDDIANMREPMPEGDAWDRVDRSST